MNGVIVIFAVLSKGKAYVNVTVSAPAITLLSVTLISTLLIIIIIT